MPVTVNLRVLGALDLARQVSKSMFDSGTTTVTASPTLALSLWASSLPMMIGGSRRHRGRSGSLTDGASARPGPARPRSSAPDGHTGVSSESTAPSIMCLSRSSTPRTSLGSMPLIATPDSSPLPRVASISAKMNGWTARTSRSISRAVFITSRYSANVACDLRTMTWALTPRTLSRNCFWNPVVTASTMVSAATPSTTPSTETLVNTENTENRKNADARIRPSTTSRTPNAFAPCDSIRITAPIATPPRLISASSRISLSPLSPYRYRQPVLSSYLTSTQLASDRPAAPGPPATCSVPHRPAAARRRRSRSRRVHHVGAQHVLDAGRDRAAFVQQLVLEQERHAGLRPDGDVEVVERGLAAGEVVVEIDHEGQFAALGRAVPECAIVVRCEPLAGLVAVAPEPLVDPDRPAIEQPPGHRTADPREQLGGEAHVVEHHPRVVADVG